tara:strand:+ start:2178 stop:2618 length:441 start_codon:yes stop_codon:yes gene_type:complete
MKPLLLGSGLVALAAVTFSSFSGSDGLAAVITGVESTEAACIEAINQRDGSLLDASAYTGTYTRVNNDKKKDIVLRNTTDAYCGSAGCVYEICLVNDSGVQLIPFSYAAQDLRVLDSITDTMHDIELTGKSDVRLVWDYSRYIHAR